MGRILKTKVFGSNIIIELNKKVDEVVLVDNI